MTLAGAFRQLALLPGRMLIVLAKAYQAMLSPIIGRQCRFSPSCSNYFIDAVNEHGAVRGGLMGLWRIARCNPLSAGGWDPVPPRRGRAVDAGSAMQYPEHDHEGLVSGSTKESGNGC